MTLRSKKKVLGVLWSVFLITLFSVNAGAFLNNDWHVRTSNTTEVLYGIVLGKGQLVAVGNNGTIVTSLDGNTWTSQTLGTSNLRGVTYGNGLFVAVGEGGAILTSPDGTTWTTRTSGTLTLLWSVTYGNGLFVAVGSSGTILTSPDGTTWTTQTSATGSTLFIHNLWERVLCHRGVRSVRSSLPLMGPYGTARP